MALQGYLTKLEMGNLVSAGMLSVNVLFSNDIQVCSDLLHPASRSGMMPAFCRTTGPHFSSTRLLIGL